MKIYLKNDRRKGTSNNESQEFAEWLGNNGRHWKSRILLWVTLFCVPVVILAGTVRPLSAAQILPTTNNAGSTINVTVSDENNTTFKNYGTINISSGGTLTNSGTLAPGNSIGTLTIIGNYIQNAGSTYQVEVNSAGQSDKLVVSGTATINGGTVSVLAGSGIYNRSTNYTILTATGGVTGTYDSAISNLAFLTPSLSYDANDVYLTLTRPPALPMWPLHPISMP